MIKVRDLAWLEFEKPDLVRAEAFAHAFGFTTVLHTADELQLRGTDAGAPCVIVRRGSALAVRADGVRRPTTTPTWCGWPTRRARRSARCPRASGGLAVDLTDPSGLPVRVVAGTTQLPALPAQQPQIFNVGHEVRAPTPRNGRRASPPGCSDWGMWCCRPPGTWRR